MNKRKILAICTILSLTILIFQIWSIKNVDEFKEFGGIRLEAQIAQDQLLIEYGNKTATFDEVLESAKAEAYKDGSDLLDAFFQVNKRSIGKPLVRLFNYRRIDKLNVNSNDDEVLSFLRSKYSTMLAGATEIVEQKIAAAGASCTVIQDAKNKRLTIEVAKTKDEYFIAEVLTAQSHVSFYEIIETKNRKNVLEWRKLHEVLNAGLETTDTISTNPSDEPLYSFTDKEKNEKPKGSEEIIVEVGNGVMAVSKKNKPIIENLLSSVDASSYFGENSRILWSLNSDYLRNNEEYYFLYVVRVPNSGTPIISNSDIESAEAEINESGRMGVMTQMTPKGTQKWLEMTEKNLNKSIAICLNEYVVSAPLVIGAIQDGKTQISGNFTKKEASILANQLSTKSELYNIQVLSSERVSSAQVGLSSGLQWLFLLLNVFVLIVLAILIVKTRKVGSTVA